MNPEYSIVLIVILTGLAIGAVHENITVEKLPVFLKPLSYIRPGNGATDIFHGIENGACIMTYSLNPILLTALCADLFILHLHNITRQWIV